ncbi:MAG: hypothetical protein SO360_01905 [Bifidobacterium tsurumiense]|uniref:hypothetical protein n=1 Tax=Bifidobacterium tsurumiense TaxID=356829 RepID=UPI002A8411AE|nr:hypothetical protein [Bifidobacterium tsurumiense]MDY4677607.1 hypothetical protein [Bifidobacterium tsurumiense]
MNATIQEPVQLSQPAQSASALDEEQLKQDLLEKQATRIAILQAEIKQREEEVAKIKQLILDAHEPGTYPVAGLKVTVKRGVQRLDARKFTKEFPVENNPALYETKPLSLSKIIRQLGEPAVQECITTGASQVVVA